MTKDERLSNRKIALCAVSLIIFASLITSSSNMRSQLEWIAGQDNDVENAIQKRSVSEYGEFTDAVAEIDGYTKPDCLKARNDTVPRSLYRKLPKPFINLGFPGTNSIYEFFECGGYTTNHFRCGKQSPKCAICIKKSAEAGLPPLTNCGKADVYAQIDDGDFFPQIELLDKFVQGYPNATFFLTFRNMDKWYHSLSRGPSRKNNPQGDDRLKHLNTKGFPPEKIRNVDELSEWFCNHVNRVRELVAKDLSHRLVEVDLEDNGMGQRMKNMFGVDESCWGHTNVNANAHSEVNESEVSLSRHFNQEGESETSSDNENDDIVIRRSSADEIQNDSSKKDKNSDDDKRNIDDLPDCLRARNNTVPPSLYGKLPKPFINLGMPKMGTTSIYEFFKCGGFQAQHLRCPVHEYKNGEYIKTYNGGCAKCMNESVAAGLPPLARCGEADVYAQIDNGRFFPQLELLEELVQGVPNATFFLTFRSMDKWVNSMSHWHKMDNRFKKMDLPGLPPGVGRNVEEFSDWYCGHVQKVRKLVAQNPSQMLVEVDIEDPLINQRMADTFGVVKSCWGHANVNTKIHPEDLPNSTKIK